MNCPRDHHSLLMVGTAAAFYIPKLSFEKLASWTQATARSTVDGSEILHKSMGSRVFC